MKDLTFAQQVILGMVNEKMKPANFQFYGDHWPEYSESYKDYNDCHGDYYDNDAGQY
jgi:IS1 family transposase